MRRAVVVLDKDERRSLNIGDVYEKSWWFRGWRVVNINRSSGVAEVKRSWCWVK